MFIKIRILKNHKTYVLHIENQHLNFKKSKFLKLKLETFHNNSMKIYSQYSYAKMTNVHSIIFIYQNAVFDDQNIQLNN